MIAAVQKQFSYVCAYADSAVNTSRATWKATDDYIRKNRNVLLAYIGAWTLVVTYFGHIHSPACALGLTKGMSIGCAGGLALGITSVKVLIPKYDPIDELDGSDGDSFTSHSSDLYDQIGRRPYLHTVGRAAYWALENHLDAKVTRAMVLMIIGNTIFGAIPVFPGTLGLLAGIAMGDEIGYVASTDGMHTPDFSDAINKVTNRLQGSHRAIQRLRHTVYAAKVPDDIEERNNNVEISYTTEERGAHKFVAQCILFKQKLLGIQVAYRHIRDSLSEIANMTSQSILSGSNLKKVRNNIREMEEDTQSLEDSIRGFSRNWKKHLETWNKKWEMMRQPPKPDDYNHLFDPFDDELSDLAELSDD